MARGYNAQFVMWYFLPYYKPVPNQKMSQNLYSHVVLQEKGMMGSLSYTTLNYISHRNTQSRMHSSSKNKTQMQSSKSICLCVGYILKGKSS